jgi:RNA binding exosome subunit
MNVSVHNVTWYATASALGSTEVISDALNWLTGGEAEISREKIKSYHGAKMILLRAHIDRKKAAKQSISHLGAPLLKKLAESGNLSKRIDDGNTLHIRLSISALVSGSIELSDGAEEQVKGRIKLEVYPGQDPLENARNMLERASEIAEKNGLPVNMHE